MKYSNNLPPVITGKLKTVCTTDGEQCGEEEGGRERRRERERGKGTKEGHKKTGDKQVCFYQE